MVKQIKPNKPDSLPQNEIICLDDVVVPIEMILPTDIVQLMTDKDGAPLADATKKAYCSRIKTMEKWFPNEDLINLIRDDIYRVLFEVKCRHDCLSTQRQAFSVLSGIMKELNIPDKANIGSIIQENREDNDFKTSQKKKAELKTADIQENHDRVDMLKEKHAAFLEKRTPGTYGHTEQMAALTQLYIENGVIRSHELFECQLINSSADEPQGNCIDVDKKQLIITNHKNKKTIALKEIGLSDELIEMVTPGVGQYLIVSPKTGKPFQDSTGFNKMLLKELGLSYSQMRRDRDTIAIAAGKEETKRISEVHGHSLKTAESHY